MRKEWTYADETFLKDNYSTLDVDEIAEHLGRTTVAIYGRARRIGLDKPRDEYAFYKGEDLIIIGTADEIAEHLGIKEETVMWYSTPTNISRARKGGTHNRRVAVRL